MFVWGYVCAFVLLCMFVMLLSLCGCVYKCLIVFAGVWHSIYPHILCCLSHPLNDAQPHFSLSLSIVLGCLVTAWGLCQAHQLSPICCITCSGPPYLPDCARRLCSWMDQTCEVKSGPSSLKGFQQSVGCWPSKCVDCGSHSQNRHTCMNMNIYSSSVLKE